MSLGTIDPGEIVLFVSSQTVTAQGACGSHDDKLCCTYHLVEIWRLRDEEN